MSRNPYFEHDSRGDNHRGMGRNRKFGPPRDGRKVYMPPAGRSKFQDQEVDVVMSAAGSSWNNNERRYNPYKGQKHSGKRRKDKYKPRGKPFGRNDYESPEGNWFRITIPLGRKLGKQFILRSIQSNCKVSFIPFNFHIDGACAVFFINGYNMAMSVREISGCVTTPDGFKMKIFVNKISAPLCILDDDAADIIKKCMSSRYDVNTHSLNLRNFHNDEGLKQNGLHVPLYKPSVVNIVVKTIKEHIPEIETLDVGDNKLNSLEAFSTLVPVCQKLVTLTLDGNKLKSMAELNHVKGMNIITLVLDNNPLCDGYRERSTYISAIRERLPKLMKLDGHDLPAMIGFDLGSETLPPSKGSFFLAEDVKTLVVQFLEQYYTIYDSADRGKLLDAYHDQAKFSLMLNYSKANGSKSTMQLGLQPYLPESRNLLRVIEPGLRYRLLKQGRLLVVSALTQLPATQHDPHSFAVDIFHVSPGFMSFSVTGVFKEVGSGSDSSNLPLRTFHRVFLVISQGSGFVIVNECLLVSNATPEQVKAFKFPAPTPSPSPAPSMGDKSPNEKQQLAIEFARTTGMNIDFSAKCLEENEWDYQKALMVFNELNSMGKIPPEAFLMK